LNAEILSIGTELLLGEIVDSNASFLAGELANLGINLFWVSQVGDNQRRLEDAIRLALSRSNIVLTTGGLGPTDDDLTREAIAAVLGETPAVDPDLERTLRARFRGMGRAMPEKNLKQAWLIPSGQPLLNPHGTAPGWLVTTPGDRIIASMPGVPIEMRGMWSKQIVPHLAGRADGTLVTETIKTFGSGESAVEQRLGGLVTVANPSVATYAKRDGVQVRVAARATTRQEAQALLDPVVAQVRTILGNDIVGAETDSLASIVGELLRARSFKVATAESVTGGLIASYLTDVPGSSEYVLGGLVAYNEHIKQTFGVPASIIDQHGVVSPETALALAEAARTQFGASIGIGSTGVAGPTEHGGKKPGIAYVAVTGIDEPRTNEVRRMGSRETMKHFTALTALDLLRRMLLGRTM
jgi:nicotinamide-nucleotide amidase